MAEFEESRLYGPRRRSKLGLVVVAALCVGFAVGVAMVSWWLLQ
jgi:hypothetical protein